MLVDEVHIKMMISIKCPGLAPNKVIHMVAQPDKHGSPAIVAISQSLILITGKYLVNPTGAL